MQFSCDAKGIGLSLKATSMKQNCQPQQQQLSLPTIKNTTPRGGNNGLVVAARKNSKPNVAPVELVSGRSSAQSEEGHHVYTDQDRDPAMTPRVMAEVPSQEYQRRKPTGMTRAKMWTLEVENSFRFQLAGFQDITEYLSTFSCPEVWPGGTGFIKCLQSKKTGYFMYFRQHRECEDKYLNRVKLYTR
jgi:hypothetical protein